MSERIGFAGFSLCCSPARWHSRVGDALHEKQVECKRNVRQLSGHYCAHDTASKEVERSMMQVHAPS